VNGFPRLTPGPGGAEARPKPDQDLRRIFSQSCGVGKMCAQIMRRILVDAARKRATGKHGGGFGRVELSEVPDLSVRKDRDLLVLDEALDQLKDSDPRKAKIVELRYFGGLSVEEIAAVLHVSEGTVTRDWRLARGWLLAEIGKAATA
jgi:RNA polymerase sigma-70 factor (ECF subfamily)